MDRIKLNIFDGLLLQKQQTHKFIHQAFNNIGPKKYKVA